MEGRKDGRRDGGKKVKHSCGGIGLGWMTFVWLCFAEFMEFVEFGQFGKFRELKTENHNPFYTNLIQFYFPICYK